MAMRLQSVEYSELSGKPKEWFLERLTLWPTNLIVGRNAAGKTRALHVVWNLAQGFFPARAFRMFDCAYDVSFDFDGRPYRYVLKVENRKVRREEVHLDNRSLLVRSEGGKGEIWTENEGKMIQFQPPENEWAAVARRDSLQHPFLEPLHEWALGVRHFRFGDRLGKFHMVVEIKEGPEIDDRDTEQVVGIFRKGERELGNAFVDAVLGDMKRLGYELDEIKTLPMRNVLTLLGQPPPTDMMELGVREWGIDGMVEQVEMSQGMFRALSVLIQLNYSQMTHRANCILIDDIGEGLDYDRSTKFIELLREKAQQSSFQLIMTTNDQFVMNHVPLDEWSVLVRDGNHVRVLNHENSKESFEEFKFMGLNNFSFFEMNLAEAASEEALAHE